MNWNELINELGANVAESGGAGSPLVRDVAYDSRRVKDGDVYVAIPGMKIHGDSFIEEAIKKGAVAVISENRQEKISVPWARVPQVRNVLGMLGKTLWNIDVCAFKSVGVTGTNGKTTTVSLFNKLFDVLHGEEHSWMFGTVENKLGRDKICATHTTPESVDIFRYISGAQVKPKNLSMEVSSHSLALSRVFGMKFDVCVWTNLTQDHLDFHKTFEEYYAAKKLLFTDYLKENGTCVINIDDDYGRRLKDELSSSKKILTYGRSEDADVRVVDWKCDFDGTGVKIVFGGKEFTFNSALCGYFNVYNMSAMIAGAFALNVDIEKINRAFENVRTVPGRMDKVNIGAPFAVIVDYAHTPDALANVLKTSAELTAGCVICVFGCGGERDKTKRPLMAKVVCENCAEAVITSDNPRGEKPDAIINDILRGVPLDFPHVVVAERREAILHALRRARAGDCVVVAGKGHETYQEINGVKHHFDDREEVVKLYKNMEKNNAA